tara:strand:- start:175 stop:1002 length:828 start_codon:yes stop_codon:yes gene_type:complete
MAELITDRDLRHAIESEIRNAKKFVFIVSPYIDLDEDMMKAFNSLKSEVIKIIVYRQSDNSNFKSGISNGSRDFLKSLPNVEFVAVKNLHAKFYINEEVGVISSMNLTKSSNHNYEIGVDIDKEDDEMYFECLEYLLKGILLGQDSNIDIERIKNIIPKRPFILETSAKSVFINGEELDIDTFKSFHDFCNTKHGYCIRCSNTEISFYPNQPFCSKCFAKWIKFKNPEYEEKYCHRCGMETNTEINEPLCDNCMEVYEFEMEREWKKINLKEQKA